MDYQLLEMNNLPLEMDYQSSEMDNLLIEMDNRVSLSIYSFHLSISYSLRLYFVNLHTGLIAVA